jgi:hypothetical protein
VGEKWRSMRIEEIEPIPVVGGSLRWRPVRRTLDVGAFGINAYVAPNAGDEVVEEHDEQSLGHEEVYVVLTGRATFSLGEETLDAPAGTLVFVRDPTVKRHAKANEPDTSVLAIGGRRGEGYEPSPWEDYFAAERHRAAGDYDAFADELGAVLERRPEHPATLYNLACAEARQRHADKAFEWLGKAIDAGFDAKGMLRTDDDLDNLRSDPRFRDLIRRTELAGR